MPTMDTSCIPSDLNERLAHLPSDLNERLAHLDRKILKYNDRLLEKSNRLVTTTNHIYYEMHNQNLHLSHQSSLIGSTRHIVSAQARTISAQATKIRAQQEMIDAMQRDIFRLGTLYAESVGRISAHEEMLANREEEIRRLWYALERHARFTEQIERETYWMHVYTKQLMLLRAAEMEDVGRAADDNDERDHDHDQDHGDEDGYISDTAESMSSTETLIMPDQPHVMLDRIVVHMIRDIMPDRLEGISDGFKAVHGTSAFAHGEEDDPASKDGPDEADKMLREDSDDGLVVV